MSENIITYSGFTTIVEVDTNSITEVIETGNTTIVEMDPGVPGVGVPSGGSTSQILKKNSNADFDFGFETLDTSIVPENGNLYFTNARADARITAQKAQANGLASLGADGKLPSSQLGALAISEYLGNFSTTTTALANAGVMASQRGDWFTVNANGGESWIVTSDNPTTTSHITKLLTPSFSVPVTPANGGFGQNMDMQTIATTASISTLTPGLIKIFGGTTPTNILGISAPSTSNFCYIENLTSVAVFIINQSGGATANNRIIVPTGFSITLGTNESVTLFYDTVSLRWRVINVGKIFDVSGTSGITLNQGQLSMTKADSTHNGYLDKNDYISFLAKLGATPSQYDIPFFEDTTSTLVTDDNFGYNQIEKSLRVGVPKGYEEATGHLRSDTLETIPDVTAVTASLTQFVPLDAPPVYVPTQIAGHLFAPKTLSTSVNPSTTNYIAGDVIDYRITAYNTDSGTVFSVVNGNVQATINNGTGASDGDSVDVSWSDNTSGIATISGYYVERQVNGGGYNDFIDLGYVNSFTDDDTAWGGSPNTTPKFPDFIANGSTRNYVSYTKDLTPVGGDVFSASGTGFAFNDDNTGDPYLISHSTTLPSLGSNARILNTDDTTYHDGVLFTENTTTFSAGSTVTPTIYGTLADSIFWNKSYDFYNFDSGMGIYSITPFNITTVDPDDGLYYYFKITSVTYTGTLAKIVRDGTNSENFTGATIYDDGSTGWAGNNIVTPNGAYLPVGLLESHGSALSDPATSILRSLDGSYIREEYQANDKTVLGYRESSTDGISDTGLIFQTFNAITDTSVPNNSLFRDIGTGKLSYKDNSGTVNPLY